MDILVVLLCSAMRRGTPGAGGGDRLILSKGHAVAAWYATLVAAGRLDPSWLVRTGRDGDHVPGHPVAGSVDGIEVTTGSLGHGLSIGVGVALADRIDASRSRTFVVVGDGELQEGSNWEAIMLGAHSRLANLVAIVDANGLQQGAPVSETNQVEPLRAKFEAFGWRVEDVDGHDVAQLLRALADPAESVGDDGRPTAVLARTTKGFPVSFMMNEPSWHHRVPTDEEFARASDELRG